MNDTNIRQLMERFLNAETTLEEERTLYEYFQDDDIADDLKPYREAFQSFAAVSGMDKPMPQKQTPVWVIALRILSSVAAIYLVGLFFYLQTAPTAEIVANKVEKQQLSPQPAYCTEGTPREILMCYLERKKEQPKSYSLIKQKIYESQK